MNIIITNFTDLLDNVGEDYLSNIAVGAPAGLMTALLINNNDEMTPIDAGFRGAVGGTVGGLLGGYVTGNPYGVGIGGMIGGAAGTRVYRKKRLQEPLYNIAGNLRDMYNSRAPVRYVDDDNYGFSATSAPVGSGQLSDVATSTSKVSTDSSTSLDDRSTKATIATYERNSIENRVKADKAKLSIETDPDKRDTLKDKIERGEEAARAKTDYIKTQSRNSPGTSDYQRLVQDYHTDSKKGLL